MKSMKVLGIDFTSRPARRKPITCLQAELKSGTLHARKLETWVTYAAFEEALAQPGSWIAGLDFPFGQARRFIETIDWPQTWAKYVAFAESLGRAGFEEALVSYRDQRPYGDKEHSRAADKLAHSVSPQKLNGVPVGKMFFEGAPRLLRSPACIPHLKEGDPERIVVEAYPGVLARALIDRRPYKSDARKKQTSARREARISLLQQLKEQAPSRYGFDVEADPSLCDDPGAEMLREQASSAALCA